MPTIDFSQKYDVRISISFLFYWMNLGSIQSILSVCSTNHTVVFFFLHHLWMHVRRIFPHQYRKSMSVPQRHNKLAAEALESNSLEKKSLGKLKTTFVLFTTRKQNQIFFWWWLACPPHVSLCSTVAAVSSKETSTNPGKGPGFLLLFFFHFHDYFLFFATPETVGLLLCNLYSTPLGVLLKRNLELGQ